MQPVERTAGTNAVVVRFTLARSYGLGNAKKPVVVGFFAQNGWLVAVYEAGTVLAYSRARAWVGVGSAIR
jgi:hypothetical protein